jgi:hypothetical protein
MANSGEERISKAFYTNNKNLYQNILSIPNLNRGSIKEKQ